MEKLRGGGEMTVFNEPTHFTLLLLEFESSPYLVSRKKRKKKTLQEYFFHSGLQVGSLPLNSGQDNAFQALKTACYLERSQGSLCITFMTSVIFTGSPGGTQGDSGGRDHFILAEMTLQAMLGPPI